MPDSTSGLLISARGFDQEVEFSRNIWEDFSKSCKFKQNLASWSSGQEQRQILDSTVYKSLVSWQT
jgi:hypothetical protein